MRAKWFRAIVFALILMVGLPVQRLAQGAPESLRDQLLTAYPVTVMDPSGIKVAKAGSILMIRQPGVQAAANKSRPFPNIWEDGKVSAKGVWKFVSGDFTAKALNAGEKVYLLRVDIKEDSVTMTVQTCGSCNPSAADPSHQPRWASIQFKFVKNYLNATDLNQIQNAINVVLAFVTPPERTTTSSQATHNDSTGPEPRTQAEQGAPRKFEDLTPPPPLPSSGTAEPPTLFRKGEGWRETGPEGLSANPLPDSPQPLETPQADSGRKGGTLPGLGQEKDPTVPPVAKPTIELGDTRKRVDSLLGNPDRVEKSGRREICVYGNMTITFKKGKVAAAVWH